MAEEPLPDDLARRRVLSTAQAAAYIGYSAWHLRRLKCDGKAPASVALSTRRLGWRVSDLDAWLEARQQRAA